MTQASLTQRLTAAFRAFWSPDHPATPARPTTDRMTAALECSDDAITIIDADGRLVYFNTRFPAFYPTIADDIHMGVPFADLLRLAAERGQLLNVTPAQADDWARQRLQRFLVSHGSFDQALSDGRWLEVSERRLPDGGHITIRRDITRRKGIEQSLESKLYIAQEMIESIPYPIYFRDMAGTLVTCNRKFVEASGRPRSASIGKTVHDFLPPDQAQDVLSQEEELLRQGRGEQKLDVTARWFDGTYRHINIARAVINDQQGKMAGCIGIAIDVTDQKRAEEKLVQQTKLATLGQIASEVAHEVNQPLSIIRLAATDCLDALRTNPPPIDRLKHKLQHITAQVARMGELIDQLRGLSRPDQSRPIPFRPCQRINAMVDMLAPQFRLDEIGLTLDMQQNCPEILGRPGQLDQVVLNLLSNARDALCQHRKPGDRAVHLCLNHDDTHMQLVIDDNGGGISPSLLPNIFDPFITTKADHAGTGLGLSICSNIINGMGGSIRADNLPSGARFTVRLPLAAPNLTAPATNTVVHGDPTDKTIILVDDEPLAVECLRDLLLRQGFQILTTSNPQQAIQMIAAHPCDLLISDIRMPGMNGISLLETIRRSNPGLPAIFLSGSPVDGMLLPHDTMALEKPVKLDRLTQAIHSLLLAELPT